MAEYVRASFRTEYYQDYAAVCEVLSKIDAPIVHMARLGSVDEMNVALMAFTVEIPVLEVQSREEALLSFAELFENTADDLEKCDLHRVWQTLALGDKYKDPFREEYVEVLCEHFARERTIRRTSADWHDIKCPATKILDPDGWDRTDYEHSFNVELIDEMEFLRRLSHSTTSITRK